MKKYSILIISFILFIPFLPVHSNPIKYKITSLNQQSEYFENFFGNISDFEDNTSEQFEEITGNGTIIGIGNFSVGGVFSLWLRLQSVVIDTTSSIRIKINTSNLNEDAYDNFTMIFRGLNDIDFIIIENSDGDIVHTNTTGFAPESEHPVSFNITDSNWTGISQYFILNVTFTGASSNELRIDTFSLFSDDPLIVTTTITDTDTVTNVVTVGGDDNPRVPTTSAETTNVTTVGLLFIGAGEEIDPAMVLLGFSAISAGALIYLSRRK